MLILIYLLILQWLIINFFNYILSFYLYIYIINFNLIRFPKFNNFDINHIFNVLKKSIQNNFNY